MLNRNKVQNSLHTAYFDQISQIEVRHVDLDFQVDNLFSEYQMPPKLPKSKPTQSTKYKTSVKKTSESSISTKERSKNQEDSSNIERHPEDRVKQSTTNSLKKNISKKILFVDNNEKEKPAQITIKKIARKKTVYSEFQKTGQTLKKTFKSPQIVKVDRKYSKTKAPQQNFCSIHDNKKSIQQYPNQQNPIRKSRQQSASSRNQNTMKKSRSQSIMSGSRQRLSSKNKMEPKVQKMKQDNRKIIMRDYFGQDQMGNNQKKTVLCSNKADLRNKRSSSKSTKQIGISRQRMESKSRERIGSKSKERVLVFSTKNRFA